jgi:glycosyl transferase family 2
MMSPHASGHGDTSTETALGRDMRTAGEPIRSVPTTTRRVPDYTYVLITPARNEAKFIELAIKSVVAQTIHPAKWVIVSDGSTDGTDEIVSRYAAEHEWIDLIRMAERTERHFCGKVHAFNAGYARLKDLTYDVIGSLDGDISFDDADYVSFLLSKLAEDPALGLVGTPYRDDGTYDDRFVNLEFVAGACQMFRRECFEDIGGYVAVKAGGVDDIAVMTARMKGWKTRTFTDKTCLHHRAHGAAEHSVLMTRVRDGALDYTLGGHPVWAFFRALHHMTKRPFLVGGVMLWAGYVSAMVRRVERPVSRELMAFHRRQQMRRLRNYFLGIKPSAEPR